MTRQLGRLEKVGKEALVKPSSLEGLRSWGGVGPSRTRTGSARPRKDLSEGWRRGSKETLVEPSGLEGFTSWGPSRAKTAKR